MGLWCWRRTASTCPCRKPASMRWSRTSRRAHRCGGRDGRVSARPTRALVRRGHVLNAWLPAAERPHGTMVLSHLSQQHPDRARPYLDRKRTEDIGVVAAEAYEVREEQDEES